MIVGIVIGKGIETLVFFCCFCVLRVFLGGIHAKTDLGCLVMTGGIWGINMFICMVVNVNKSVALIVLAVVNVFVIIRTSYKTKKKNLRKEIQGIFVLNLFFGISFLANQYYQILIITTACSVVLLTIRGRRKI